MPKVSIIVPVYKAEKYLHRCVDSILAQTFRDWECILVDDGSPDGSGAICDEYAQKDARIHVIHKENGGVSSARNTGIDKSNGEWLCFIDSDDTVEPFYVDILFKGISGTNDVELSVAGYRSVDGNSKIISTNKFEKSFISENLSIVLCLAENNNTINSPVCKLFKKCVIMDNDLKFHSSLSYGEDHVFVLDYLLHVNAISVSNKVIYNYFHRENDSLTSAGCTPEKMITYVEFLQGRYERLNYKLQSKDFCSTYNHQLHDHLIRATYHLFTTKVPKKRCIFHRIHKYRREIVMHGTTSLFYSLLWYCLKLPEILGFYMILMLCYVKKLIVSLV